MGMNCFRVSINDNFGNAIEMMPKNSAVFSLTSPFEANKRLTSLPIRIISADISIVSDAQIGLVLFFSRLEGKICILL